MKLESRRRAVQTPHGPLFHNDLVLIADTEVESLLIDSMGQPGTTFKGEVRLADGYGEHYLLIQPLHIIGVNWERTIEYPALAQPQYIEVTEPALREKKKGKSDASR